MAKSTKTRPPSGWASGGTRKREAFCLCPRGHRFVAELYTVVDLEDQPEALESLTDAGLQPARCSVCGAESALAEALLVLHSERKRAALFVPDALAHRALELHAEALLSLAAAPSAPAPQPAADPAVAIGVAALHRWLFGEEKPAPEAKPAPAAKPKIHAAFADLDTPERPSVAPAIPSIAPAGPQLDGVDVNEPLLDDDWLADESIAPSRSRASDPGAKRGARGKPDGAAAKAARREPKRGVDFAGLLTDDRGDDDDG